MTEELIENVRTVQEAKDYIKTQMEYAESEIKKLNDQNREAQVLITKNKKREAYHSTQIGVYDEMLIILDQVDQWGECVSYLKGRAEQGEEAGEALRDAFGRCSAEDFAEVIQKNVKRMEGK